MPRLLGSLFVQGHNVSWGLLLSQFGKMSPAFIVPPLLCLFTNPLYTNIMLACGLAVVSGWGTGLNPHSHPVSCTSVLSRVSMGQPGRPVSWVSTRCTQNLPESLLLSCLMYQCLVSSLCMLWYWVLPCPAIPLLQPLSQFALGCFFVAKPTPMEWRTGTFGKPTLKSNIPGP